MAFVVGADEDQEPPVSVNYKDLEVLVDYKQFYANYNLEDLNEIESHRTGGKPLLIGVNLPKHRRKRRRRRADISADASEEETGTRLNANGRTLGETNPTYSGSSPSIIKIKTSASRSNLVSTTISNLQFGKRKGVEFVAGGSESDYIPQANLEQAASDRLRELLKDDNNETHALFCELEEFQEGQWHERARWVRFEEDVEEGGGRWSKPFVATLPLHALFELRQSLLTGVVLLDLTARSYYELVNLVVDYMIGSNQLEVSLREEVTATLLSKHVHQHQHGQGPIRRGLQEIGRKFSSKKMDTDAHHGHHTGGVLPCTASGVQLSSLPAKQVEEGMVAAQVASGVGASTAIAGNIAGLSNLQVPSVASLAQLTPSREDSHSSFHKFNEHFARKLAPGTEASSTLVGAVPYLNHAVSAFVRLSSSLVLDDLTEVAVATRFVFVMLGPTSRAKDYREIGRAMSTIMSDDIFRDVAYRSVNRLDLLAGLDEFLDEVTVLPPGEWDPTIRIQPPKSVPTQEERKMNALNQIAEEAAALSPALERAASTARLGGLQMTVLDGKGGDDGKDSSSDGEAFTDLGQRKQAELDDDGLGFFEPHFDPALQRTGRLFGGLVADVKRKVPFYLSDLKDALHIQCIASTIFLFFACLSPIVTFGGLLAVATENHMAAFESILTGSVAGTTYHLFAGQPLTVIGSTGPVLVFEKILYSFCKDQGWAYLTFRFWVGIWSACVMMLMVAFDLSALVQMITRFTEECFAALISTIFIFEAFLALFNVYRNQPFALDYDIVNTTCLCDFASPEIASNFTATFNASRTVTVSPASAALDCPSANVSSCTSDSGCAKFGPGCNIKEPVPDVFFFSCLLFIGTFGLSMFLKAFRNTPFFPNRVREIVSDFAVSISILLMVVIDALVGLNTPKLDVPRDFSPTLPGRTWLVNPFANATWTIPIAIIPALLLSILLFMDQQITAVIVNRRENKLKKGCGYHLDFFILTLQVVFCATFGLPYFVAATVLAINHVNSLRKQSDTSAPGEQPKFLGIREQRVTGFLIFALIACAIPLKRVLGFIPMPVLFGVFFYMGVTALRGSQFFDRILLIFMPVKYQPDSPYLRHMKTWRVHLFTAIQLSSFVFLWVVKQIKVISISFPLMLVVMVILRKLLDYVFSQRELHWVDDILPKNPLAIKDPHQHQPMMHAATVPARMVTAGQFRKAASTASGIGRVNPPEPCTPVTDKVNITDQVGRTNIWQRLKNRSSAEKDAKNKTEMQSLAKSNGSKQMNAPPVVVVSPSPTLSQDENV